MPERIVRLLIIAALVVPAFACGGDSSVEPPEPPAIALSATSAELSASVLGSAGDEQSVTITNGGEGTLVGLSASIAYENGEPDGWLTATLNATQAPASLTLTASPGSLEAGSYGATVTVDATDAGNGPQTVDVTLEVAHELDQAHTPESFTFGAGGTPSIEKAQTFTVGVTGTMTQVDVWIGFATADVQFDVWPTTNGGLPDESGAPLYSESIPNSRMSQGHAYISFPLGASGIPVEEGEMLAFMMRATGNDTYQWNGTTDDGYPHGAWYFRAEGAIAWETEEGWDAAFRTFVTPD